MSMNAPVFLVTGGSRGIGAAIAAAAAGAGYQVLLSYVSSEGAALEVVERIRASGGVAEAVRADTGKAGDVEALFAAADRMGRLQVLAYNGGITGASSALVDAVPETIARVIEVNLTGAMLCARAAIARMSTARGGEGGAIVLLSSRATSYGSPGDYVWYAASKGGVDALTLGLAREVGPVGIRVNAVSPGPIGTEMLSAERQALASSLTALRRVGEPEEVADAVMYLASDKASYVTGANLAVSGGR
jgi:NAD(P)-dependent dehydrogenase (short-subunit alcohol dehydrogenase family)